jgi:hypothetical protein
MALKRLRIWTNQFMPQNANWSERYEGLRPRFGRVEHGFFDFSITCEVIQNGRRRLTIKAGKNYQFVIPEQELWIAK